MLLIKKKQETYILFKNQIYMQFLDEIMLGDFRVKMRIYKSSLEWIAYSIADVSHLEFRYYYSKEW